MYHWAAAEQTARPVIDAAWQNNFNCQKKRRSNRVRMNPSQLSEFVLKLVSSAVDSYPAAHQQNMIGLVREVVMFDAAWWGWSSFNAGLTTLVNSTTYNLPPDYETAFRRVSGKDPFIRFGKRLKDFALSLPTDDPSLQDEFRDFLSDFGIRATLNGHCRLQGATSYNFFMSLYRFDRGARFSQEETADFRLILRHLEQSLSLSLRAELRSLAPVDGEAAILGRGGAVVRATRNFLDNFAEEGLSGGAVEPVLRKLVKPETQWSGNALMLTSHPYADGLTLVLQSHRDLRTRLSTAEREVAELYMSGMTMKQIAASRNVSSHTIRNQLSNIYRKIGARGKLSLARLLGHFS
jgi:DNA-binding CsgD family transcriptional regulator